MDIISISTAEQFNEIRNNLGAEYNIEADIDLSEFNPWEPIGTKEPFVGKINGDGHSIRGLNVNYSGNDASLFGYCKDATIQDLYITGKIGGYSYAGGIAGHFVNGHIINCHFNGSVAGTRYTGGIAGYLSGNAQICSCSKKGYVSRRGNGDWMGGIVGYIFESSHHPLISKCYYVGDINGKYCGGIVGYYGSKTEQPIEGIVDCYHYGNISGSDKSGGICCQSESLIVKNCYSAGIISASGDKSYAGGIIGVATNSKVISSFSAFSEIKSGSNSKCNFIIGDTEETEFLTDCFVLNNILLIQDKEYKESNQVLKRHYKYVANNQDLFFNILGWDKNIWQLDKSEYPYPKLITQTPLSGFEQPIDYEYTFKMGGNGTPSDPYLITGFEQLRLIENNPDKYYVQKRDIAFADSYFPNEKYWKPICNSEKPFTGTYDGGGFKIIVDIDQCNQDDAGLFGVIGEAGQVMNLQISGQVNGRNNVGAVAGYNRGRIKNCFVDVEIRGNENIGGIVGSNQSGIIISSFSSENTSVDGKFKIGGIVGENAGFITQCYTRGTVSGISSVGGITGINYSINTKKTIGIARSVAINSKIYAQNIALCGKITGENYSKYMDNFSSNKLILNGGNNKCGMSIALDKLQTQQFWSDTKFWGNVIGNEPDKPWKLTNLFPVLYFVNNPRP